MVQRSGCSHDPPKLAIGWASADSSKARSRRPVAPPYRAVCPVCSSSTSSTVKNSGLIGEALEGGIMDIHQPLRHGLNSGMVVSSHGSDDEYLTIRSHF